MTAPILWTTVRPSRYGSGYDVHGFFVQPSGVLAGQTLKRFLDRFDTLEAAQTAYPDAAAGSDWTDPHASLLHLPCEDDPVAGGMYPDDY